MRGVILAAGGGTRLRPLTETQPKCLVPVRGTPIIVNALAALRASGCTEVSIVVGHLAEVLKDRIGAAHSGMTIDYVENPRWADTNSMFSLHLALEAGPADYVLEGDVYFTPSILKTPEPREIGWLVDSAYRASDGSYLRCATDGVVAEQQIVRNQHELSPEWAKSVGILRLSRPGSTRLRDWLRTAVSQDKQNLYYDLIIAEHLAENLVRAVDIAPAKWFEIDTIDDLANAESLFA